MWVGLPQLVLLPFVPKLMKIFDPRLIAAVGLAFTADGEELAPADEPAPGELVVPDDPHAAHSAATVTPMATRIPCLECLSMLPHSC